MRFAIALLLLLFARTAFGLECTVTCPKDFLGGCVESAKGCACSCRPGKAEMQKDIDRFLKRAGAKASVAAEGIALFDQKGEVRTTTLRDKESGDEYTVFVRKQKD